MKSRSSFSQGSKRIQPKSVMKEMLSKMLVQLEEQSDEEHREDGKDPDNLDK